MKNPFREEKFEFDVFISHAVEDKQHFTEAFVEALSQTDLKVWYSGYKLKPGNKLMGEIDAAISRSAYCVAIISLAYLEHKWTRDEYAAFYGVETVGQSRIIPIWHGVTESEVRKSSPMMADRFAISSELPTEEIVEKIVSIVRGNPVSRRSGTLWSSVRRFASNQKRTGLIGLVIGLFVGGSTYIGNQYNSGRDLIINPGADEHFQGAWNSIHEEMKNLFSNYSSLLWMLEEDNPAPYWGTKKINEIEEGFQQRALHSFRQYEENIQMYRRKWPINRRQYEVLNKDLVFQPKVKEGVDFVYRFFEDIDMQISEYQDQLLYLQRLDHISDTERAARAKYFRDMKIVEGKRALVEATLKYIQLPEADPGFPEDQFRALQLDLPLPEGKLTFQEWNQVLSTLYQQKTELLSRETGIMEDAQKREIKRQITDPYLVYLRKLTGLPDSLTEGEYENLKKQTLDNSITDPAELFERAAFSFIECDGQASAYYFRQALKNTELSPLQQLYARVSIYRIENPATYQGSLGIMVLGTDEGGNLEKSGIKVGDVIVALDGIRVNEPSEISSILGKSDKAQVVLDVIREGKSMRFPISGRQSAGGLLTQMVVLNVVRG
ncbi:MAG: TIR domain-containing protein [Bacteroidia bacterium]